MGLKDIKENFVVNASRDWKPMEMFLDVRGDMGATGKSGNESRSHVQYSLKIDIWFVVICWYCIVFILYISTVLLTVQAFQKPSWPQQLTLCQSLQTTLSEGLAQVPCVVARVGFEPTTLRSKGIDSTYVPLRPTIS